MPSPRNPRTIAEKWNDPAKTSTPTDPNEPLGRERDTRRDKSPPPEPKPAPTRPRS